MFTFTGKERDSESGLDYFNARYFAAVLGRFTSPDSLGLTRTRLLHPERLNKYSYASTNPLRYVDPDGLDVTALYEPGIPGHFMLFANNPTNGQSAMMSFGPRDESSAGRTVTALNGPQASTKEFGLPLTADQLRENFAALTIQTKPEDAQKVIDAISHFDSSTTSYQVLNTNCTSVCRDLMKDIGILPPDSEDLAPFELWQTVYFASKLATEPSFFGSFGTLGGRAYVNVPAKPGTDYGKPRFGMGTFDFIHLSTCQDSWDPGTNTLHGCL